MPSIQIIANKPPLQLFQQAEPQLLLLRGVELLALAGDVKHVHRLVRFGIDEDNFDVAAFRRHRADQVVEQARAVLGDDVNQGGRR